MTLHSHNLLLDSPPNFLNQVLFESAFNKNPEQEAYYKNLLNLSCVNKRLNQLIVNKKPPFFQGGKFKNDLKFISDLHMRKKEVLRTVKSLKNELKFVDISDLINCNDNDVKVIFDHQKNINAFSFNRVGISKEIISKLKNLEHLKIKLPEMVTKDEDREIAKEKLGYWNFEKDVTFLISEILDWAKLRSVDIDFKWSSQIQCIAEQNPNLKTFHLNCSSSQTKVDITNHEIKYLKKLPLESLTLIGCNFGIQVGAEIANLEKLKKLKLVKVDMGRIPALDTLKSLQKLHLEIPFDTNLPDLTELTNLEKLTIIERSWKAIKLDFLFKLPSLKKLTWYSAHHPIPERYLQKLKDKNIEVSTHSIK